MASSPPPNGNPNISPSKQTRIDIWRTEVAAAVTTPPDGPSSAAAPASSDSTTSSLLSSSSSSSSSYSHLHPSQQNQQHHRRRRRGLWRRLARRLSGRAGGDEEEDQVPGHAGAGGAWDHDDRTAMYRVVVLEEGERETRNRHIIVDDALIEEESDGHGARRGLKDKQARLERAARLLGQGGAGRIGDAS